MAESQFHINLVRELYCFAQEIRPGDKNVVIYVDLPDVNAESRPPQMGNSRPDLFAHCYNDPLTIVGEAKTALDLERSHTVDQLRDFIRYLVDKPNPLLVMATPWLIARTAATNIRRELKRLDAGSISYKIIPSALE